MVSNDGIDRFVFDDVASKIVSEICSYLDYNDLKTVRQVNGRCYAIVNQFFNIEKKAKYNLLYNIYKQVVLSKEKVEQINRLNSLYGFFGSKIKHIIIKMPRRQVSPFGEISDCSFEFTHLDKCNALGDYALLLNKRRIANLLARHVQNGEITETIAKKLAESEGQMRLYTLLSIEVISKLCFNSTSIEICSEDINNLENSVKEDVDAYLLDLKTRDLTTYEELKQSAESILPDLLEFSIDSSKRDQLEFFKKILPHLVGLESVKQARKYFHDSTFELIQQIVDDDILAEYPLLLKNQVLMVQQELTKLFDSEPSLDLLKQLFDLPSPKKLDISNFFFKIISLESPVEIMVTNILYSIDDLYFNINYRGVNVIKMIVNDLEHYSILDEKEGFSRVEKIIVLMKLLYYFNESTFFESTIIVLNNIKKAIDTLKERLDLNQFRAVRLILNEIFSSFFNFSVFSKMAFRVVTDVNSNQSIELPFIDYLCKCFSEFFNNRLIKRMSLLMPSNKNLEKVQPLILHVLQKSSYIFPAAIKLFTDCEFDSDQERMDAIIQFLEKIPDYKNFKNNIKFTYNFKSDEYMKKQGILLLKYILKIPFDEKNKDVLIDSQNIHLLLPFIELFMKKFPNILSIHDLKAIRDKNLLTRLCFVVFRQLGFSSEFIDLLEASSAYSELIELIKEPRESFLASNYFKFENLPQNLKNDEIASIIFERELRAVRYKDKIPFIIKDFKKFCKRLDPSLANELKLKMARKLIKICIEMNSGIVGCGWSLPHHHFRQFTKDKKEIIELYRYLIEINPNFAKYLTSASEIRFIYENLTGNYLDHPSQLIEIKDEQDEIKKMIEAATNPKKRLINGENPPSKKRKEA